MPLLLTFVVAASVRPVVVRAQTAESPPLGAEVRVRALPGPAWRRGELLALDRDRLVLGGYASGWRTRPDTIPLVRVERVEVRRPTADRTARTVGGAFLGGLIGVLAGGFVGYQLTACGGCDFSGLGAVVGAPLGGLLGIGVGAGVARTRAYYWEPVALLGAPTR
jgi:hypothetical protein